VNAIKSRDQEPGAYKSLQILDELSNNDSLSQRDLSKRLGIALGLVNSYMKNLIAKGYITVKAIPAKRYAYYLTPKGFSEKTRLTYDLLQDYTRIYREARETLKRLFREISSDGVKKVVFAGADDIAEIAYITLQETDLVLVGVVDGTAAGKKFLGRNIKPIGSIGEMDYDLIIVASYLERNKIYKDLLANGVKKEAIKVIFPI
jgi:DNA-binding MarR family transcriptional regulator